MTSPTAGRSSMRSCAPPCAVPGTGDNRTVSKPEADLTLEDGILTFNGGAMPVCWRVEGPIINSATKHRDELRKWKVRLAREVKAKRGRDWDPDEHRYAVTLHFRFRHRTNQKLDVDNYVKPILDGLAAGLFLPEDKDPGDLPTFAAHHGVDDSTFRDLLIRRLDDISNDIEPEDVRLFVSRGGNAPPR